MIKHRSFFLIVTIFFVAGLHSCQNRRYVYSSPPPNNPFFTRKGESKVAGYFSFGGARGLFNSGSDSGYNYGYDVQAAYAFSNHWAVTTSFTKRKEQDNFFNTDFFRNEEALVYYKRTGFDVGAGYFTPVDKGGNIQFTIFGGVGPGKLAINDTLFQNNISFARNLSSRFSKFYLQPGFNIGDHKYINFAILTRFTFLHFSNISTNYNIEQLRRYSLNNLGSTVHYFIEPSMIFQLGVPGLDWAKLEVSGTFNLNFFSLASARGFTGTVGLNFDLSKFRKL